MRCARWPRMLAGANSRVAVGKRTSVHLDGLLDEPRRGDPLRISDAAVKPMLSRALDRQPLRPRPRGPIERRTHDYVYHRIRSLFAALEAQTGRVFWACRQPEVPERHRRCCTRRPRDIHLILDNYGTHKTPAIDWWPAKRPAIVLPGRSYWVIHDFPHTGRRITPSHRVKTIPLLHSIRRTAPVESLFTLPLA